MKKWTLWVGLLAIFLSGAVAGYFAGEANSKRAIVRLISGHSKGRDFIVRKLTRELNLSETQREYVSKVVCRTYSELSKVRRERQPEIDKILTGGIAEIKQQLDPAQKEKLDALYEHARKRRMMKSHKPEECE